MKPVDRLELRPDAFEQTVGTRFRTVVTWATYVVAIIAIAGLLGYISGFRSLGSIRPDYIPMAPATAVCFLIFSAALYLHNRKPLQRSGLIAMNVLVLLGTLFCITELTELVIGINLNYSDKLFPATGVVGNIPIGRMSPATAATFSIAGPGILLLLLRGRSFRYSRQIGNWASSLGILTMIIGATVLLAYMYGTPFMYSGGSVPVAVTTALALLFLGVALVVSAGPDNFLMSRVTGDSTAALLSRVFLSLTVTTVLIQSILMHSILTLNLANEALIIALLVVLIGIITVSVVDYVASLTGNNIDEVNRKLLHALQELQKSEEQRRTILMTAMDGFLMVDTRGRILEVNETYCRLIGYSEQELLSMGLSDLAANETPDDTIARINMIIERGEERFVSRHRHKNGCLIDIEISAQFRSIEDGRIVVFLHDITARKQIEEELKKKNTEVELFIYTVSHDLRSPLVTVKTFMGYLEKDIAEGNREQLAQDIQYINGAADKMKLLLDDLLEMSRIGRVETSLVSVSLREVQTEALGSLAGVINERKVDIFMPDTELMLFGDRQRLCQIWQNLIENAIKYSPDGSTPRIELGVNRMNGETVFFVKDNGIGIDSQYHGKVFGIFDKLDAKSPGSGLGLSMVKRIVENCGGRIWVESEGSGKGSCFFFTLPQAVLGAGT